MSEVKARDAAARVDVPGWVRFAPSANARSVAILRISVGVGGMHLGLTLIGSQLASLPRELWVAPAGTDWAVDLIPVTPGLFRLAAWGLVIASAAVIVGFHGRAAASIGVLLGLYAGWVPHLTGKVDHYHHVIWFLALIVLSPCDDALAVRPSDKKHRPDLYAAVSLSGALMLGVIYLSSALPKLTVGLEWALSDNMRNIMWWQWYEKQHSAPLPVDQWPGVYRGVGLATMTFETFFLPAVLFRSSRRLFAISGVLLHLSIWVFLGIGFWTLMVLYVVLFDWNRNDESEEENREIGSQTRVVLPILLALVVAMGGLTGVPNGWPLAGYPLFGGIAGAEYAEFVLIGEDVETPVTRSGLADRYGTHHVRVMIVAARLRDQVDLLLAHASRVEGRSEDFYRSIHLVVLSTDPDSAGSVLRREPLSD